MWLRLTLRALGERALWLVLLVGFVSLALAYQSPRAIFVDVGGPLDGPHTVGFNEPEKNPTGDANFRWSTSSSSLVFPGVGKPLTAFPVTLQLSSGRDAKAALLPVSLSVNGHSSVAPLMLKPSSESYVVTVDPAWVDASGDLRLDFTSPTFKSGKDQRELGFIADFARIDLPAGLTLPSFSQLCWLLLCGLLLYLLLRSVWLAPRVAGFAVAAFLLACAGAIAIQRLLLTIFSTRMAVTLLLALVTVMLAEALVRLVTRWAGWRGERSVPEWAWAGLRALVAVSLALKVGGLLYPHTVIIDAPFHIKYITYMHEGRPFEEYFGKQLAEAVMPPEEWGKAKAFIPYSPFFYIVAAPLADLPVPLELSVPAVSGIFEALKVALVFLVALALGTARRREDPPGAARIALMSAGVYSAIPATFLLQQFGNWPTQTSLWFMTLWAAVTCLFWARLTKPLIWAASTVALTLTMLTYTVTAVYVGVFLGLLVVLGWIFAAADRKRWAALALSALVAVGLSMVIYYGRYLGDIINSTLPTFLQAAKEQGSLTTLHPSLYGFITGTLGHIMQSYKLDVIYALGLAGTFWFFFGRRRVSRLGVRAVQQKRVYAFMSRPTAPLAPGRAASWQAVWVGSWLLLFPLFTAADFYVDQAFKEFWIALPAIALAAGIWLLTIRARAHGSRALSIFMWLLPVILVWQSISLWVFRLFFHNR